MKKQQQSEWDRVLEQLKKNKNPLYDLYKDGIPDVGDQITFYFPTEETQKPAQKKWPKLQKFLPSHWQKKRIKCVVGKAPSTTPTSPPTPSSKKGSPRRSSGVSHPLQALNHTLFTDRSDSALEAAIAAERQCTSLYQTLTQRTELLATTTIDVDFIWRVRVGGIRGFDERLLPVFHPVYGVPYIPSSSLKGILRAWARANKSPSDVERLLGDIKTGIGCVQIFDAFPTQPCLDLDVATPQWSWSGDRVPYQPVPHVSLSLLKPTFKIGLAPTHRGTARDVQQVRGWIERSLVLGVGSRIGSGYGRTGLHSGLPYHSEHAFQLWTQGIYGAVPPTKQNRQQGEAEFRPSALRGVLRYWFRAVALSLYPTAQCQQLEAELFGAIAPHPQEGSFQITADWTENKGDRTHPHVYQGRILLAAKTPKHLQLLEQLLYLATHLGGVGRGSRRPLHWNDPYPGLRGCYWQLESDILPYNLERWQQFFADIKQTFLAIQSPHRPAVPHSPGEPGNRYQDVLDGNTNLFLVKHQGLKHPSDVENWPTKGKEFEVRGEALDLLYSSDRFKGRNQSGKGNKKVGGALGTPSFVMIQSNFPSEGTPYQAVTVFGAGERDRATFVREIRRLPSIQIL